MTGRGFSLHVTWASDGSRSGGSIAAMRTVAALRSVGEDARVAAVADLGPSDLPLPRPGLPDRVLSRVLRPLGIHDLHRASSLALLRAPLWRDAAVVHLHVIHSGVLNYGLLPVLCAGKRVVLTLHDMWPFTGNCVYSYDCERWRDGCGQCPYPDRQPAMQRDGSRAGHMAKRWVWPRLALQVVAPSRWIADLARQSMLGHAPVHYVPYPIDTDAYAPRDRAAARARFGIDANHFVLLASAHRLGDPRKGLDLVPAAVAALPAALRARTTVLTFGDGAPSLAEHAVTSVHAGYLSRDDDKAAAYAAADLLLLPTRADNLPLMVQESMACGTPVLASRVGGIPDMVRPGVTGDLFEVDDADGLRAAIEAWAGDPARRAAAAAACRALAEREYTYGAVGDALRRIYAGTAPACP